LILLCPSSPLIKASRGQAVALAPVIKTCFLVATQTTIHPPATPRRTMIPQALHQPAGRKWSSGCWWRTQFRVVVGCILEGEKSANVSSKKSGAATRVSLPAWRIKGLREDQRPPPALPDFARRRRSYLSRLRVPLLPMPTYSKPKRQSHLGNTGEANHSSASCRRSQWATDSG
jgi:hypothetical protein